MGTTLERIAPGVRIGDYLVDEELPGTSTETVFAATHVNTVTASDPMTHEAKGSCPATTVAGCTITGLTNGTAYDFTATATNNLGTSVSMLDL